MDMAGNEHLNYEPPSAEDYFSDNTQGRKQSEHVRQTGASSGIIRARRKLRDSNNRKPSIGQRILHAVRKISEAELNAQLDKLNIPRPNDPGGLHPVIRDGAFPYISELLRQFGQGEWALRPRTFCILRILGCVEAMDAFIAMKRTDAFLPYDDRNLPDAIKGADMRSKFLKLQGLVLSHQHLNELEEEGGAHMNFRASADDYFSFIKLLGQGGSGTVDHVYGTLSLKNFARKRIHRGISALQDQQALSRFENELTALKAASHRHLVKLVSSYTDPTYVGLIMRPVADEDLKSYLRRKMESEIDRNARRQCLRTFFGCLTKALEYLHLNRIHHKDIKPQNVLVKNTDVYLTDFGTAKTLGDTSRSLTTGRPDEMTPRYCAPEVADMAPRGKPSDIWSMGCVFLEMATVLKGFTVEDMETYYSSHGTTSLVFWKNDEATAGWIEKLVTDQNWDDNAPLTWAKEMLQESQTDRPSASQVLARIVDTPTENRFFCLHCLENQQDLMNSDYNKSPNMSTSDVVTGTFLQSYMQRDFSHVDEDDENNDTITSKMLEDAGAVSVADDQSASSDQSDDETSESNQDDKSTETELQLGVNRDTTRGTPSHRADDAPRQLVDADRSVQIEATSQRGEPQVSAKPPDNNDITEASSAKPPTKHTLTSAMADKQTKRTPGRQVKFEEETPVQKFYRDYSRRFLGLREDQRPQASEPLEETADIEEMPIIPPEPLKPPPLNIRDCYPLPKATLVPSYILAGSNRFSLEEVRASDPTLGSFNLFVYGRLMFPSVLRAFAARSMNGVYSPIHQRRLVPSSADWARANLSVKCAAEVMTPALLRDYDVWRPTRMECAAIQESSWTSMILEEREAKRFAAMEDVPPGQVNGFLIRGLSEEALRYCDLVFSTDTRSLMKGKVMSGDSNVPVKTDSPLERKMVIAQIQLTSGAYRSVTAYTYVWSKGLTDLWHPWRPENFIRGSYFQDLSFVEHESATGVAINWRAEETALAETMKIGYALVGDELCSAILADDLPKLHDLLENYDDVDAMCRKFGTPLQAAVATGNGDMVRLLLRYGANPSAQGGKYGTPLIAATMGSKKSITRMLLKERADVFTYHSQHVNALYQAVGHGDWAITEMLLEAGAWLSKDYGEIKDLAIERRDRDLQALLQEYDVRDPYQYRLKDAQQGDTSDQESNDERNLLRTSSRVMRVVMRKFIVLSSESGSWRGRKGVAITRAALAAGAPPMILDYIRNAMDPVSKLIDLLKAADSKHEEELRQMQGGRVEELGTDDEDDQPDAKSPSINVIAPDGEHDSSRNVEKLRPDSRRSSTSSVGSSRSYDLPYRPKKPSVRFRIEDKSSSPDHSPPSSPRAVSPKLSGPRHVQPERDPMDLRGFQRESRRDSEREYSPESGYSRPSRAIERTPVRSRPIVPYINTSPNRLPPVVIPYPTRESPRNNKAIQPAPSPTTAQYLAPPANRRPRARSLDDPYGPTIIHQAGSHQPQLSSPSYLAPAQPVSTLRRSNSDRRREAPSRDDNPRYNVKPRRSSDTSSRLECERCNGHGFYRQISSDRAGREISRAVDCKNCGGTGRVYS